MRSPSYGSGSDHLDLDGVTHPGFFEVPPEVPVDEADGREVLHARDAEAAKILEEWDGL